MQKMFMKHFTSRRQLPKLLLLNSLRKFLTEGKYLMNEGKIYLGKIIKSINYQTNESPSNNGFPAEIYKHTSIKLASVLLDA